MKKLIALTMLTGASSLYGAITQVSDVTKIPASGVEGRIEYTGQSATATSDLTLTPAANKASTFKVNKSDAELTLSGKVSVTGGAFIKSGPGLLHLAYPGSYTLGQSGAETANADLNWDSDGIASKGFTSLTVADGTLELGANRSAATVKGGVSVGVRYAASSAPVLKITGGTFNSDALYLDRGYSSSTRMLVPTFEVSNCSTATLANVYTESGGNSSHMSSSVLASKGCGALLKVTGYCSIGKDRYGTNVLNTLDGAQFQHTAKTKDYSQRIGLEIGGTESDRGGGVRTKRTVWNIDGGTGSVYAAYLNRGSEINIKNGGKLNLDRSILWFGNQANDWQRGTLNFDGGTIGTWYSRVAEWFTGITNYTVGSKGMAVVSATDYSALGGHSSYVDAAARIAGAEISVEGSGTVALGAGEVPIRLKDGKLIMGVNGRHMGASATGRINVDNSAALVVSGENTLQNMVFEGGGRTTRFRHQGIEADCKRWRTSGHAGFLADGSIRIGTREWIDSTGTAYLDDKVPVDRSFSISWTYFGSKSGKVSGVPYGVTAVLQNDKALACGTSAAECCYDGISSSVAVSFDAQRKALKFGRNGTWSADTSLLQASAGWATDPIRCSIAYDADVGKMVFSVYSPSLQRIDAITNNVNLVESVGGSDAWFGFLGGTSSSEYSGFHVIGDVRISTEKGAGYQKVGGKVEIAEGETWRQELLADQDNLGFVMNELSYGDGARLLSGASGVVGLPSSLNGSVNIGFDKISGEGELVKDGGAGLALSAPGVARSASVDLREGSIILRKENMEMPTMKASDGGWCFTGPEIYWVADRTLQFGPLANGRGISAEADRERVMNANTRRRYRMDGAWRISFRAYVTSVKGENSSGFSFLLHNDPAGCEKRATGWCGGGAFANAACFRFWTNNKFVYFGNGDSANNSVNGDTAISFDDLIVLNEKDSEVEIVIEHNPSAMTMKVTMTQGEKTFSHTWENVDIEDMIGGNERAFLSFGANGHYANPTVFRISDFEFAHMGTAPAEEDSQMSYLGTLTATGSTVRVVLDSTVENANYRLADNFKTADGVRFEVRATKAQGVLDLGECEMPGAVNIYPRNGCMVKSSKLKGTKEVTVDGGTLIVASGDMLSSDCVIKLYNGGKLRLDNGSALRVKKLIVDGVRIPTGVYADENCEWIDGGNGEISTGCAMRLIFR